MNEKKDIIKLFNPLKMKKKKIIIIINPNKIPSNGIVLIKKNKFK